MSTQTKVAAEDFGGTRKIYDELMADNVRLHDMIYPAVFGADQYIGQFSDNSADELRLMGRLMQCPANSQVLDIGCGRGCIAEFMARAFGWRLTGIDLSEVPIAQALGRGGSANDLHFIHGNIYETGFDAPLDAIYGTGAFCHFDAQRLFARCHELLADGGRLAFMERIRLAPIAAEDWERLTSAWCCPSVYHLEEYRELLEQQGFQVRHSLDLSEDFRHWQQRSVSVREQMKADIIAASSEDYYRHSLDFARYENRVTQAGQMGYCCIVAEKRS